MTAHLLSPLLLLLLLALLALISPAAATCPYGGSKARRMQVVAATADDSAWMPQIPEATDPTDPLVAMNNLLHEVYADGGQAMLPMAMVVNENDYLVLLRRNSSSANATFTRVRIDPIIPPIYHYLKMVAHAPLSAFVMLTPYLQGRRPFPSAKLYEFVQTLNASLSAITADRYPDPAQLQRQQLILTTTRGYITQVLASATTNVADLASFAQNVSSLLLQNVADAAKAEINLIVKVMGEWQQNLLTPDEWQGLRFVVSTSHMAANRNLVSQVFARLLSKNPSQPDMGPNDPNRRFITVDDMSIDEDTVRTLLGTHYTDYAAGQAFFGGTYVLHTDVLANATESYLNMLYPSERP